jgi:dipeptidyl aminopeptidase/acylaminoacyl peptidase
MQSMYGRFRSCSVRVAILSMVGIATPAAVLARQAGQPATQSAKQVSTQASTAPESLSSISIERFLKIRTPGAPSIAPDGTMYVRDWPDGIFQLYRVDGKAATPDAKMTKLTSFKDGLAGYSVSPDGARVLLFHAVGGNENTQISLLDPKADGGKGAMTPITENPKVQHSVNHWFDDSSGFIFTGNDESPNDFYIYRYDFKGSDGKPAKTKLLGKPGSWSASDATADKSRVLVEEYRSISDTSAYELNTKTGELKDLGLKANDSPTTGQNLIGYMPGETAVLMIADIENGMPKLFLRDLASGQVSKPISALDAFEIDGASMNPEKTLLSVVTNEDGYGVLHLYRLPSFEPVKLPAIEPGVVGVTELKGDRISWALSNPKVPGLAYTWTVPAAGAKAEEPRQLTFADTQGIDLSRFSLPELVKYKSFDGVEIPAFVYLPPGVKKGTPVPFVVNYHGGPEGQFRPTFSAATQYLLAQGFGVIQPNVRGSTGYGRKFHMMDDYKKRWDSVKDGVLAAKWLVDNGYSKPGKMSTYGGSYGGFMSVACLVEDQERVDRGEQKERLFGAGVNVVGIVNMKTFLEQTSGYRRKLREAEYGPLTDPEFLASVSSMNRIDKINVPMMIAHGLNDPRVPVGEAMQLAIGLMNRGMEPVQFYAPDEGHGFQKLSNRLLFNKRMVQFYKDTIGKD